MKKRLGIFLITLCMSLGLWCQASEVWAASGKTSVSVSSNNVNIGDTVTVTVKCSGPSGEKANATMTLSYDSSILQFVSCSTTYGGGGGSVMATGENYTVTLKAIGAGSSNLSVSGNDGVLFDTNEELDSMSGTSAAVIVNNAAGSSTGNNTSTSKTNTGTSTTGNNSTGTADTDNNASTNTDTDNTKKSADNSLKSLTISPGTLSPNFQGSTVNYTATVANDVTNIAVSAVPVNANAVVESVSGNEGLKVGTNAIKVVVKAENGVTATYTIQVTRLEEGTQTDEAKEQDAEVTEGDIETETLATESTEAATEVESTEIQETETANVENTEDTSSEITYLQQEYNELSAQYEKDKSFLHTIIAILVFIIAVLVIVIINLLIQRFRNHDDDFFDEDHEEYDDEDSDEEIDEEPAKKRGLFTKRSLVREDDELEDDEIFEEAPKNRREVRQMPRTEKEAAPRQMPRAEKEAAPKQMPRAEKEAAPKQMPRAEKTVASKSAKGRSAVEDDLDVIDFNDL